MIRDLDDRLWRKASTSGTQGGSACVELHPDGAVRDSKNPAGGALPVDLQQLIGVVKAGRLTR